jgi:hypothetical protein
MVHDLPHPGLLPKEKENCPPPLWKCARLDLPEDLSSAGNRCSIVLSWGRGNR